MHVLYSRISTHSLSVILTLSSCYTYNLTLLAVYTTLDTTRCTPGADLPLRMYVKLLTLYKTADYIHM
ncbi:hypothetical protein K466DRAFT_154753 [Polyporus arcularius HHB13444]|uniref:Uncharacterized protein n=1 Tax=Polyporus arcularius HHB13444 TaxID=1314778 RepID=A0A5C3PWT3_9APHY|nr:hypothetical protein K466DRAFT_154753 [Polyporus arcularius HHB13444]